MKAHLAKVSLALLSAAFLLGCQEQGSGPVGLEGLGPEFGHKDSHNPGGGGGGDGGGGTGRAVADVTITGGMVTDDPESQPVNLSENDNTLKINASAFDIAEIELRISLTTTLAAEIGACTMNREGTGKEASLFGRLSDLAQERMGFFVDIDKNNLGFASKDHKISVTWKEGENGPFDVAIRFAKLDPEAGSPTVTLEADEDINGNFTATFSGGSVVLRDRDGKPKDHLTLVCPNLDDVLIALVR